jgi:hypothetical protein
MSRCRVGIMSTSCLAGSTKILSKRSALLWSSAQYLDASTRSQYRVISMSAPLSTFAVRHADPYSPVVMLARTSVAAVAHARVRRLRGKSMANVVSLVAVTTPTAGMSVPLLVTAMKPARSAMRGVTSNAVMPDARKNAVSHARLVLKRSVRLAAHTRSATCRVPLHAIGCHVRSDAKSLSLAAINAHPSVVPNAPASCTVIPARQPKSKTFEPTSSC